MNAIMTKFDIDNAEHRTPKWEGLSEIDQAIRDNRVMEYRMKKSWAERKRSAARCRRRTPSDAGYTRGAAACAAP